MAKKTFFVCSQCGNNSPNWLGKCPVCGEINSYSKKIILPKSIVLLKEIGEKILKILSISMYVLFAAGTIAAVIEKDPIVIRTICIVIIIICLVLGYYVLLMIGMSVIDAFKSFLFNLMKPEIAIDLGSSNTVIMINGKIVLDEPSVIATDIDRSEIVFAFGRRALSIESLKPNTISFIYPIRNGTMVNIDATKQMIELMIRVAINQYKRKEMRKIQQEIWKK